MSKTVKVLFTEKDREALQPVLEALRAKGLRVSEAAGELRKDDTVLAALSEAFYADQAAEERLLGLIGSGAENVMPLQMDAAPMPEGLKNAIYSRNIIPGTARSPEQIAERVVAALPQKKSSLPKVLLIAGIALIAIVGLLIWRAAQNKTAVPEAPADEITIPVALGLTEEELAEVRCVAIIGEHFSYFKAGDKQRRDDQSSQWRDMLFDLGNAQYREDTGEFDWYWNEDGTQASMTTYDLRFLSLMPNLEELHMAKIDVEQAPDLSGLQKMSVIWAYDCRMDDLTWIARSNASKLQLRCHADYAPLSGSEALKVAILDSFGDTPTDFSSFSPKHLQEFHLSGWNLDRIDLSGLKACGELRQLRLHSVPVRDLSFLQGNTKLTELQMDELNELRDISALRGLSGLRELNISPAERIADLSPIAGCTSLKGILLDTHEGRVRDVSFLKDLKNLERIDLYGVDLQDLNFLEELGQQHKSIRLAVEGNCSDWSGLSAVDLYSSLQLIPWEYESLDDILPHLENATIREFVLRRFSGVDLSRLPRITDRLELDSCDLEDLSTMPENWSVTSLNLNKCSRLRSLDGLQNQNQIGSGYGRLEIFQCPRLTDWSALDGMKLTSLFITGGFTLPSFENFRVSELRLDSVADVTDLEFLSTMDAGENCNFALVGLDELKNLSPLSRFHGQYLAVSPQLQEQAEDLVKAGNFWEFRIEYPEGGWEMDDMDFSLLSLDELETLPPALLRRIDRVCIAGDQVVDPDVYEVWDDWEHTDAHDKPGAVLHNRQTDEETRVKQGSITDLNMFSELTGLRDLRLFAQPITSLDGIQNLSNLQQVTVAYCSNLKDASPIFALQDLWEVNLRATSVESIQGVQNLQQLRRLDLYRSDVTDLSPLAGCDFHAAAEQNGFSLNLEGSDRVHFEDLSALASIPRFDWLCLNNIDALQWLPYVEGADICSLGACNALDDDSLSAFIQTHPGIEELHIQWNEDIHDLSGLLDLPNLRMVRVSRTMEDAIRSLDGVDYHFELFVEG